MAFLTEEDRKYTSPEDICAHLGDEYGKYLGAIVPPIFQNTLFIQPTEGNGIVNDGYVYSRVSNPTTDIAERKIAALEGGDGALCFATGMAAISAAMLHFARAHGHIILVETSYGGAKGVAEYLKDKFAMEYTLVEGTSVDEIRAAIRPETCLIHLESPSSCIFRMQDLDAVTALAKEHGIATTIDATYGTPLHQQPLKHGVDVVCHTASKYLGGHSDIMGGVVVARREIIESIQNRERSLLGGNMDPHQAWLLLRGLRTLPVRLKQHGENAAKVAAFLEQHPAVEKVLYPGSATYDQPEMFQKYLSGANGLLSIILKGTEEDAHRFISRLHYFQNGCSWGGFESLVIYLGSVAQYKNVIRLHIGLENPDTLISDLAECLRAQ